MKKWWLKLLLVIAVVLVVVLTWLSISSVHSKNDVERYKERLRVAGEKLTVDELTPPRASPESNGVPIFEEAVSNLVLDTTVFGYNPPQPMVMVAPGKAMIRWQQPDILNNDATNSWDFAKSALQSNSVAIALLQRAAERGQFDFGTDYKQGLILDMSHQAELRPATLVLESAAVEHLREGDTAVAVTNIHTILAILNAWQDERVLMLQTFRIALAQMAVAAQWELLQATNVTEPELASLQRDWTGLEFGRPMENAFLMERLMASVSIQRLRDTNSYSLAMGTSGRGSARPGDWFNELKNAGRSIRYRTSDDLWRMSWSYEDELQIWQFDQISVEALRRARADGFFKDALAERDRKIKALGLKYPGNNWLRKQFPEAVVIVEPGSSINLLQRLMGIETARQMAVTSIAVKRYQLRHEILPPDLNALLPDILSALPRDPVDGHPLRYRPNSDGTFLLYSIGGNAIDDGGDPTPSTPAKSLQWQRGRDWVWPQPATQQEVDYFRAHPPN
jgi:hypothetical protein